MFKATMTLDFNKICRLCLMQPSERLLPLFHQEDNLPGKVMTLIPVIKLCIDDGLPTQVCSQCVLQVNASFNFKIQCETADATLKQLVGCHQSQITVQEENMNDGSCLLTTVKEENIKPEITFEDDLLVVNHAALGLCDEFSGSDLLPDPLLTGINEVDTRRSTVHQRHDIKSMTRKKTKAKQNFVCDVCGKILKVRKHLLNHMLSHTGEKPFSCDVCLKAFALKECLKIHSRIHTGEKPYCCADCGVCFTQKSGLLTHKNTHTGHRPYSCIDCGLKFVRPSHLQAHMVRHTGEKAFSCSQCSREFGRRDSLKKHMRVHTGHKPYLCTICGKRFAQSQNLKVHIATHSENKPFICLECGKTFANNARLKDHLTVHSGKRPFSCQHCAKGFVRREHLKYHLNAVHGKERTSS
ncbi:oocyte zinc finger protein XlCOF6.1-like [Zootermopsis nevadensis]|uniref:Uncharacterized protein n=1 Tax=Zootermopsis nevadensis TaxID=136037 RepID=A0A067QJV0_ZOONE|nr:oocyte zinc finger protein XlCOF6.1-like [Zootermopsis nevadensis]KDR07946.1 hypothetical protein L798_01600 [Zootermopsis nevadensis]